MGGCHGGLLSTIVDVGGSLAIAAEDMHATGVSTDLNVSFVSGAKLGDKLSIVSSSLTTVLAFVIETPPGSDH